jgi:hypothetical protein
VLPSAFGGAIFFGLRDRVGHVACRWSSDGTTRSWTVGS